MSTPFYDLASLVLVPSGYKTSKVYAQKPLTTDGQLAFTRSTTATRVGPDGLIEKVRTNVALYSEQFDNAYWTKSNITVTANSTTNPINGATTADTIARSGGASSFVSRQIAQTGIVTFSVFAKAGSTNEVRLNTYDGSTDRGATYNLTTGAISSVYGSPLFTLAQDFGSGWYRIRIAVNAATYTNCQVHIDSLNSVIIFGAQLETGDIATPYIATTTAAVSVGMLANVPRLDYLGGGCPKLLLEPQRTNLQLNSEDFSQANWSKTNTTIVVNQLASPDGYVNADKLNETAVNNIHQLESTRSVVAATQYTMSVFAKKAERSIVRVYEDTTNCGSYFDLNNGTLLTQTGPTTSSKIENYGNGWYRCSVTYTETNTSGRYRILVTNADNVTSYLGVAGNGIYIYGAQYEAGAYATSYIPTLGAAVTRGADAASKTGISSLIGQTEGTIFVDFVMSNNSTDMVPFDIAGSDGKLIWIRNAGAQFYGNGTTLIASIDTSAKTQGTRYKVAFVYGQNDFRLYRNGSLIGTDTSGTFTGTFSDIALNSVINQANGFNQILLFKTKLTNAQLAELTTI